MKKLMIIVPVALLLVGGGGGYFFVLKPKPAKAAPKPKIEGEIFPIEDEFIVNLAGGRYGKVSVALLFDQKKMPEMLGGGGGHGASGPVELVQAEVVRAVITDALTGLPADDLIERRARHEVVESIIKDLNSKTDVKVDEVFLTDVVVQ
jgi:flagellar basal body-associated protein FliL